MRGFIELMIDWLKWFAVFYAVVPSLLARLFGFRALRRIRCANRVALTFDDGPDPVYTPRLLDLLRRYGVRATFFLVGERVEKYPDLVRRIRDEGHLLGIHNHRHRANWLMSPFGVRKKQLARTADAIERCTGERPRYYRPPWGLINLFDLTLPRTYRIVLWSVMGWDWWQASARQRLRKQLLDVRGGDIVLLHDCGETPGANRKAPEAMLGALEDTLPVLIGRGVEFVRIDELEETAEQLAKPSRLKRLVVGAWLCWERVVAAVLRFRAVGGPDSLLRFRIAKYHRRMPLPLGDDVTLRRGDRIVELHFDNARLYRLSLEASSAVQLAVMLLREVERLLPVLADTIASSPKARLARALYGISLIHRGPERFGFRIYDLPDGFFTRLTGVYLRLLLAAVHPSGKNRLRERPELLVPKQIAMPLEDLFRRHGTRRGHGEPRSASAGETA